MFDHEPNFTEIEELLKEVPAWHGAPEGKTMADYQGYVISISQKVGPRDNKRTVWRLYTTVAGKVAILHDAHRDKDGNVVPIVEAPQYEFKGSMVLISGTITSPIYGTVWCTGTGVTGEGASGADLTNPIENAETSWRGRAASALCGAGVLPYTGIASAEEVQTASHREDMAEAGYRVISADAGQAARPAAQSDAKVAMVEPIYIDKMKAQFKVKDTELEKLVADYCTAKDIPYEAPFRDFLLQQEVRFLNGLRTFIQERQKQT